MTSGRCCATLRTVMCHGVSECWMYEIILRRLCKLEAKMDSTKLKVHQGFYQRRRLLLVCLKQSSGKNAGDLIGFLD